MSDATAPAAPRPAEAAAQRTDRTPTRRRVRSSHLVGLCVLFTVALRAPFLTAPLLSDEAGLLIVAEHWQEGPYLYGDYFVGRGIVLVLTFKLAETLGGVVALRLLAGVAAVALVLAAGWAGHVLRGRRGAGWAALVAAAYGSTFAFSAQAMNERLVAAALVMTSCACMLAAVSRHRRARSRYLLAVLAGAVATCAVLVVQSFAQGVVFAAVLVLASWRAGTLPGADAVRIAAAGLLGVLLPVAGLAVAIGTTWLTWAQLWFQMFGYRLDAVAVLADDGDRAIERFGHVSLIAVVSGMVMIAACLLLGQGRIRHRPHLAPTWWAVLAIAAVAGAGMFLGGAWYSDYLLELVPSLVLATALVAPEPTSPGLWTRAGAMLAVLAAVVSLVVGVERELVGAPVGDAALGRWLGEVARDDDTAVILWGEADVLHAAGLDSPYPFVWSLLTRTLDSDLELLLSTMRGPDPPTWIVEYYPLESWDLDESGDLAALVRERYVRVGMPCGYHVYLLRSAQRPPPPVRLCGRIDDTAVAGEG